jgi:hypothetical protein
MTKWPVRDAPVVFASARTLAVPGPATGCAVGVVLLMTSHGASAVAVHVHVESGVVTVMIQFASVEPTVFAVLSSVTVLHAPVVGGVVVPASCVTANAWPPTLIAPLRAPPVFACTVYDTVPLPVPDAVVESTVSQLVAVDAAVHVHVEADAVTAKDAVPPLAGVLALVGVKVNVQVGVVEEPAS